MKGLYFVGNLCFRCFFLRLPETPELLFLLRTMADLVALRAAYGRLGFTPLVSQVITDVQGIDSLYELSILTDAECENLCKTIRRPGGMMVNPAVAAAGGAAAAAAAGIPAEIPNPGHPCSLRAENNLKLATYFLRFKQRTSRETQAADITVETIRAMRTLKDWEKNHEDVEAPKIDSKDWPRTFDNVEEYLSGVLGTNSKIPLAYVIRANETPADDPENGWPTPQDELINRAPILDAAGNHTATFLEDRAKVWELISDMTRNEDCWTYIKPSRGTRNGRAAFLDWKNHFLGPNNVDNQAAKAEATLANLSYTGERRNWNWEKYVSSHKDQHSILQGLTTHGYAGIDDRSKVRRLMEGIKTTELDVVKTQIMSSATLRSDFDACCNLFQDFIIQRKPTVNRQISAVTLGKRERRWDEEIEPDMSVPDRYYKGKEYAQLTTAQKLGLKIKRSDRAAKKHKAGKGKGKNKQIDLTNRAIKAIATALAKTSSQEATTDESNEPTADHPKDIPPVNNRNNKALQRKK